MIKYFLNFSKVFNVDPSVDTETGVECYKLKTIGLYCLFLFLSGTVFNGLLLWTFYRNKELRTPMNMFIIALTIFNLFGCLLEMPFVIVSNMYCKYEKKNDFKIFIFSILFSISNSIKVGIQTNRMCY
jgi:hypothetical protein